MKWFVYILYSPRYRKTYTGHTDNVEKRVKEHNSGKSKFTSRFIPWELIHTEEFDSREQALKRERYYKSGAGRKAIAKIFAGGGLGGSLASLRRAEGETSSEAKRESLALRRGPAFGGILILT